MVGGLRATALYDQRDSFAGETYDARGIVCL